MFKIDGDCLNVELPTAWQLAVTDTQQFCKHSKSHYGICLSFVAVENWGNRAQPLSEPLVVQGALRCLDMSVLDLS